MQAGGVHDQPAAQLHRLGAADLELDAAVGDAARLTGLWKANMAPLASASPCSASM